LAVTLHQILILCAAAFAAGFVDAIVGGGGLIQTPAALVVLRSFPVASAIGSIKIPSFSGTLFASFQYVKKVRLNVKLLVLMCTLAFFFAFAGSMLLTRVSNVFMKPVLLVVLAAVAVYTFTKKDFGQSEANEKAPDKQVLYGCIISILIGFYDGFIGPGAGSFLILAFISLLGHDFLHASAHAKLVNLSTNLGSILLFSLKGTIIWTVALPMAACNALGGILGARLAIRKGNRFIRWFFLLIVLGTLARFSWDVFSPYFN
jgi:uncharacterized membrane protein YfcA